MANRIILKRNVGVTGPTGGQLVPGEPAIAMDGPTGANSKLFIGIADTITGSVDNVVAIGGGYYTAFVDDIYSKKTIIQGTEQSFTTALRSKITGNEAAIAAITGAYVTGGNVSQFANDAGYLSTHDHNTVDSFNGATGAVIGVSSVAGLTGTPNASAVRTAIDVDEIYTKKSIIEGTEQSFTTALKNKLDAIEASADVTDVTNVKAAGALIGTTHDNYVISVNGATGAISAATGGGNISQFSNDSHYLTGFTITTSSGAGATTDSGIADDEEGNPPQNPRINELNLEAGNGISMVMSKITGANLGQPDINAGAKIIITNDLAANALLKSGGVTQVSQNPIFHTSGKVQLVSAELDITNGGFIGFTSTGKVTGNMPVDGDGVFGGIIEAAGVSGTGRITGSNIPSTGDIVTGGGAPTFSGMTLSGDLLLPEDGVIQIGGDTEKIVFNGSGSGSSSIDIFVGLIDIGTGSGCKLRSAGDVNGTYIEFVNDAFGSGRDGLDIYVDDKKFVDISTQGTLSIPTGGLNVTGDVTVEGDVTFEGDFTLTGGDFTIGGAHAVVLDQAGNFLKQNGVNVGYLSQANGLLRFNIFSMQTSRELCHLNDEDTFIRFPENGHVQLAADGQLYHQMLGGKNRFPVELTVTGGVEATGRITGSNIPSGTILSSTFGATVDANDQVLSKPVLKDFAETVNAIGSINSNTAVDFENGNVQTVTVAGNCEFSFSNPPASGKAGTVTLIITNGGAHTVTYHSSVKWPSDVSPSLTTSGVDIITFLTIDAGTTVYGFVGGLNLS